MKYLFVIAMQKESKEIINHYGLKKVDENYYKNGNKELIITDISRNGITNSLINLLYKYKLNYKDYVMINIGMVGSNNLPIESIVGIDKSYGYHFDLTPFNDPLYHAPFSPFQMEKIEGIKQVNCYTSDEFVLKTDIKEDVVFDMELNSIVVFPFKKHYSIKIVSDSLSNCEYNNFNYNDAIKKVFKITDKIMQDK